MWVFIHSKILRIVSFEIFSVEIHNLRNMGAAGGLRHIVAARLFDDGPHDIVKCDAMAPTPPQFRPTTSDSISYTLSND